VSLEPLEVAHVGRRTKLTASQHEEIRATVKERCFLARRIVLDKLRIKELSQVQLAKRYGVGEYVIRRILGHGYYVNVRPEPEETR